MSDTHTSRRNRNRRPIARRSRYLLLYILLLVATLFAMAALRTCGKGGDGKTAQGTSATAGDTIRVAIIHSPLSYYIYSDTLGGLNYDLLRRMSDDLGRPVKFVPVVSIEQSLAALRAGNVDILASLLVTADMKNSYLFSEGVYLDRQVLIQRRLPDGKLRANSVLDLAGDTIHIEKNSAAEARLHNMADEIGENIVITAHPDLSDEFLFLKVLNGDFKYAVINEKMARRMIERHPEVSADTQIGFTQFQSWLTRKSDTRMLEDIDTWLLAFKETDDYKRLVSRYIPNDSTQNTAKQHD